MRVVPEVCTDDHTIERRSACAARLSDPTLGRGTADKVARVPFERVGQDAGFGSPGACGPWHQKR
jgi:hypothetical protein